MADKDTPSMQKRLGGGGWCLIKFTVLECVGWHVDLYVGACVCIRSCQGGALQFQVNSTSMCLILQRSGQVLSLIMLFWGRWGSTLTSAENDLLTSPSCPATEPTPASQKLLLASANLFTFILWTRKSLSRTNNCPEADFCGLLIVTPLFREVSGTTLSPQWGLLSVEDDASFNQRPLPPKISPINSHYICVWKGNGTPPPSPPSISYVTPIFFSAPLLHCTFVV